VAALIVGVFDFISSGASVAKRGLLADRPPVYGRFSPHAPVAVVAPVAIAVLGALWARRGTSSRAVVAGSIAFLLVFGAALAAADGGASAITAPLSRVSPPDYQQDVPRAAALGIRAFVSQYPRLIPTFTSIHTKTHPPGPVVLLAWLQGLFPRQLMPRALVLALLSALVVVPTWMMTRELAGARAAGFAAVLIAAAPGVVLFTFTSLDAVFATILATASALFVRSIRRAGQDRSAFVGGLVAGFALFFTYAVAFVGLFAAIFAFVSLPPKRAGRFLLVAGVGALAAILILRIAFGFDVVAVYRASHEALSGSSNRSQLYWLFGDPAVWLTFAGLPIAALGARTLLVERPRSIIAFLAPLAIFYLLPSTLTKIVPGEVERTLLFAYPLGAAAAAMAIEKAGDDDVLTARITGSLVLIAALQAILLEMLYNTFW
jgi:4-amino-4-deoxy-L-arabinose transferase-like glycosyltransferase